MVVLEHYKMEDDITSWMAMELQIVGKVKRKIKG
jgi:hypothetical protein